MTLMQGYIGASRSCNHALLYTNVLKIRFSWVLFQIPRSLLLAKNQYSKQTIQFIVWKKNRTPQQTSCFCNQVEKKPPDLGKLLVHGY